LPQDYVQSAGDYKPGPIGAIHDIAEQYMADKGLPYNPPKTYVPVDKARAERIAQAYEDMPHEPEHPAVKASYEALAKETKDQFRSLKDSGIDFEYIKPNQENPYAATPRLAAKDVLENKHLWVYPTESGFGTETKIANNPLLKDSGETIGGKPATYNDLFRVVHDVFGHFKDGNGFRAAGEENAWRSHSAMYSDVARPAMTAETRGQNSWVNFGPHGEANRKASAADTVFADQKNGRLPDWVVEEGRHDATPESVAHDINADREFYHAPYEGAKYPQYAEEYPPVGPPVLKRKDNDKVIGKPGGGEWTYEDVTPEGETKHPFAKKMIDTDQAYWSKKNTPEAARFAKDRAKIQKDMDEKGYRPYFDPEKRENVNPKDYPSTFNSIEEANPKKAETQQKWEKEYDTPEARARIQAAYDRGSKMTNASRWYWMKQLQDEFKKEYGGAEGTARFKTDFADPMAATTGGATPTSNYLMAHYGNYLKNKGIETPVSHQMPYPIGGRYAATNMELYDKSARNPAFKDFGLGNEKRYDFSHGFLGHNAPVIDEQMSGLIKPGMQMPNWYGPAAKVVSDVAKKNGVDPLEFQGVAWAGHKAMKAERKTGKPFEYEGPMINQVNDVIERTHRLTGMPRSEIVRRGNVGGKIPLYGIGGAISAGAIASAINRRDQS
jgi:hypothetical protein